MRRRIISIMLAIATLCTLGAACSACNKKTQNDTQTPKEEELSNEVQVVVLLGQSNAEGATWSQYLSRTMGAEKTKEYTDGYSDVLISYACAISANTSNGQFTPVKPGQGSSVNQFGPEVGMAEKFSELNLTKRVYIIKYAYGATSLTTNWRSPTSKNTGNLYNGAVQYINEQCQKLEEMDLYPVIKAICWMQGEDDSSGLDYNSYEKLERNFVADLRNDLAYYKPADAEIGFIDAGISDCPAWTQYQVINAAKEKLSGEDENHIYIDTIAAGIKYNGEPAGSPDIYHFDSSSQIKLGHLFAQAVISGYLEIV